MRKGQAVVLLMGLVAGVSFVAGFVSGVSLGEVNAHIDFCADDTSGRYIQDPSAHSASCD